MSGRRIAFWGVVMISVYGHRHDKPPNRCERLLRVFLNPEVIVWP
jgi:hypothetical protein